MKYINFRKAEDADIVLADGFLADQGLHISKLQQRIKDIQTEIDGISEPIPNIGIKDDRILALIAEYNESRQYPENLKEEKTKVEALLYKWLNIKKQLQAEKK
jgi:hypothetical protein